MDLPEFVIRNINIINGDHDKNEVELDVIGINVDTTKVNKLFEVGPTGIGLTLNDGTTNLYDAKSLIKPIYNEIKELKGLISKKYKFDFLHKKINIPNEPIDEDVAKYFVTILDELDQIKQIITEHKLV